jgi:hypothetical protein
MSNDYRMRAKYTTECPRCLDWINEGSWIVQDESGPWIHAVCPSDLVSRQSTEPTESYVMRVVDGKVIMELEQ